MGGEGRGLTDDGSDDDEEESRDGLGEFTESLECQSERVDVRDVVGHNRHGENDGEEGTESSGFRCQDGVDKRTDSIRRGESISPIGSGLEGVGDSDTDNLDRRHRNVESDEGRKEDLDF